MGDVTTLTFINQAEDIAAADVMFCQHNAAAGMRCNPVAWRVLRGVAREASLSFDLPRAFDISVQDMTGQTTPVQPASVGTSYEAAPSAAGPVLQAGSAPLEHEEDVAIPNLLKDGAIHAHAYKDGRLVAARLDVEPGETAAFRFLNHVYIGLAAQAEEGALLSDAVASRVTTRLNLFGVRSADIIMRSTNRGPRHPQFHLENIQC